jgi:MFS family permease
MDGPFVWNKIVVGVILGSYFFGYALTQIPGAWLSLKIGSKKVIGFSILGFSVLNLLIPYASSLSYVAVILIRILIGVLQVICILSLSHNNLV